MELFAHWIIVSSSMVVAVVVAAADEGQWNEAKIFTPIQLNCSWLSHGLPSDFLGPHSLPPSLEDLWELIRVSSQWPWDNACNWMKEVHGPPEWD